MSGKLRTAFFAVRKSTQLGAAPGGTAPSCEHTGNQLAEW